jgi:hypothetical protein
MMFMSSNFVLTSVMRPSLVLYGLSMKGAFIHLFHFFIFFGGSFCSLWLFCKCIGNVSRIDIQHFNLFVVLVHIQGNTPLVVVSLNINLRG